MKFIVTEDWLRPCRCTAARVISGWRFLAPRIAGPGHRLDPYRPVPLPGWSDYEAGALSFKDVTSFNLDEYRGP